MFPILQLGPLAIQAPGLFILAGLWLAFTLSERAARQEGIAENTIDNLIFLSLAAAVIFGRLGYALRYPSAFLASPLSLFSLNISLFDGQAAALGGLLTGLIYGQRQKMPFWKTLDTLTPGLAMMGLALALAHVASGNAFGAPSQVPWAIELWGARRQPVQIYETILAAGILLAVWPFRGKLPSAPGTRFAVFVILTAAARLFLEMFRGDSSLVGPGFRSAQITAWLILAVGLVGLGWLMRRQPAGQGESTVTETNPEATHE